MKDGKFRVAHNTQPWFNFTLQRGHIFGQYEGLRYVSACEPDPRNDERIIVYQSDDAPALNRWRKLSIHKCCALGFIIRKVHRESPYPCVTFPVPTTNTNVWTPTFPTTGMTRKSPRYSPKPPSGKPDGTWVDVLCVKHMEALKLC